MGWSMTAPFEGWGFYGKGWREATGGGGFGWKDGAIPSGGREGTRYTLSGRKGTPRPHAKKLSNNEVASCTPNTGGTAFPTCVNCLAEEPEKT